MWLDDGGYCDWVRQYGDSSKFWWEWWGADCYSITWWKRCWMKGFLRLHMILVEGGQGSHFDKDEKMTLNELWIAQTYTGSILVAVNPYQVFLHHYCFFLWQRLCFHQTFKRKYFQTFHQVLPIYTTEQIKLYRQSKYQSKKEEIMIESESMRKVKVLW